MAIQLSKKTIILGAVGFVAALALTITVLILANPKKSGDTSTPAGNDAGNTGACQQLTKSTIQGALNGKKTIYDPHLIGTAELPGGDTSQVCIFPFDSKATADSSFGLDTNAFSFELFTHATEDTKEMYVTSFKTNSPVDISGIGDAASYAPRPFSDNTVHYELVVYKGLKHYTFRITVTNDSNPFSNDSARDALEKIARSITY